MEVINLNKKLNKIETHWSPGIVGELNGQYVKLAKLKGEFVWHNHKDEDEMFLVIEGVLLMHFEDKTKEIREGEFIIVPKGVLHKPEAIGEVKIMLFEPKETKHTGEKVTEFTNNNQKWL